MFHLNPGAWLIGRENPEEDRNRMHLVALHEARIATDHRRSRGEDVALAESLRHGRLLRTVPSGARASVDLTACCA